MVAISCFYNEKQVVMVYNFFMIKIFGHNLNISMMKSSGHFHNNFFFLSKVNYFHDEKYFKCFGHKFKFFGKENQVIAIYKFQQRKIIGHIFYFSLIRNN